MSDTRSVILLAELGRERRQIDALMAELAGDVATLWTQVRREVEQFEGVLRLLD